MQRHPARILGLVLLAGAVLSTLSPAADETPVPDSLKNLIKRSCSITGCHQGKYPAMNLNLEPANFQDSIVNFPSSQAPDLKIIDKDNPEKSYLLKKVKGDPDIKGRRMPLERTPLTDEEIKILTDWASGLKPAAARQGYRAAAHDEFGRPESQAAAAAKHNFTKPAFWGTRLANLPTTTTPGKGEFLFRVSHRFQPAVTTSGALFGLDGPSFIALSFGYGITDSLAVTLGRTNLQKTVEVRADWMIIEQGRTTSLPFSAALHAGTDLVTQNLAGEETFQSSHWKFNAQVSLSHQFSNRLSVLVVPSFATNTNHWETDSEGTLALGLGGRFMFMEDLSVLAEWIPVLAGYSEASNGWALGLEKKIGGHVFQFFILNSFGLTADQYLPGGDLRLADGDLRLGFNIFRTF